MRQLDFIIICGQCGILPELAIENNAVLSLLKSMNGAIMEYDIKKQMLVKVLNTEF